MTGIILPRARHAVADGESSNALANFEHGAGGGIPEHFPLIESRLDLADRRANPFASDRIEHLFDQIGTRPGLADERLLGEADGGAFGARADQGKRVAHQQTSRCRDRRRHVHQPNLSRLEVLDKLFHGRRQIILRLTCSVRL